MSEGIKIPKLRVKVARYSSVMVGKYAQQKYRREVSNLDLDWERLPRG